MPQGERDYLRTYPRKARTALLASGACACPAAGSVSWCSGPSGRDWATCLDQCKACRAPQPRRKDLDVGVARD
jgi:hypothetical protein